MNQVSNSLSSADIAFFHQKSAKFAMTQNAFWYIICISFKVFQVFKDCFNKDGYNFDMSTKIAALDLLKIKVF